MELLPYYGRMRRFVQKALNHESLDWGVCCLLCFLSQLEKCFQKNGVCESVIGKRLGSCTEMSNPVLKGHPQTLWSGRAVILPAGVFIFCFDNNKTNTSIVHVHAHGSHLVCSNHLVAYIVFLKIKSICRGRLFLDIENRPGLMNWSRRIELEMMALHSGTRGLSLG